MGAGAQLPVGLVDVRRSGRASGGVAVGAGERLPVGLKYVFRDPLWPGTWRCCSGRGSMTARGTS